MNQERTGLFIKTLREEKGYTQEELAERVFRGRDAISKWERGKNLPDAETLVTLSRIFDVSVNEILAGERKPKKDITLELYDDRNKLDKQNKRIIIISMYLLLIVIACFFFYYFISQYKKIHVYTVSGQSDNFNIVNGLFIQTNDEVYFSIGNIVSADNEEIKKIELYYISDGTEKLICSRSTDEMFLKDHKGYEEYFDFSKMEVIYKNLYLKIYYGDDVEIAHLKLVEDYINDKLFFSDDKPISKDEQNSYHKTLEDTEEIIKKIESKFSRVDGDYQYDIADGQYKRVYFYSPASNTLIMRYIENETELEDYIYHMDINFISYKNYRDSYSVDYYDEEYTCTSGKCTDYKNKVNEFFAAIEKDLFD